MNARNGYWACCVVSIPVSPYGQKEEPDSGHGRGITRLQETVDAVFANRRYEPFLKEAPMDAYEANGASKGSQQLRHGFPKWFGTSTVRG